MSAEVRQKRFRQAEESLEEAKVVREARVSNLAVLTKLYHAMIYSLMALYEIEEIGGLTHADLIERFKKEYVERGLVDSRYLEALMKGYEYTHECDCIHMKEPEDTEIENLLPLTEGLLKKTRDLTGGQ